MKLYQFTVEGSGEFPVDMLRFDYCYPQTVGDSAKIPTRTGERRAINLECYAPEHWKPSTARWNSFNWAVK